MCGNAAHKVCRARSPLSKIRGLCNELDIGYLGQLALLRGMIEAPIRGENYLEADIVAGRVGREQAAPGRAF